MSCQVIQISYTKYLILLIVWGGWFIKGIYIYIYIWKYYIYTIWKIILKFWLFYVAWSLLRCSQEQLREQFVLNLLNEGHLFSGFWSFLCISNWYCPLKSYGSLNLYKWHNKSYRSIPYLDVSWNPV
jgi:hypothetical protein